MKVLITGSTAAQCNPTAHSWSPNFAGLLAETLTHIGADVEWSDPQVTPTVESLEKYDKVIVGLASPLAIGSNRIYGALNTIDTLWGDSKLALFLDQPDPNNITRGLKSVANTPTSLRKEFFTNRKGFDEMSDPMIRVKAFRACEQLRTEEWPTTLVPAFPWMIEAQFESELPKGAYGKIALTNLDRYLIRSYQTDYDETVERENRWMAERTVNRKWIRSLELENPVVALRSNFRVNSRPYITSRLNQSLGFLHGTTKYGKVWWSPKVAIALSQRTPVFTDWQESRVLGKYWATLPGKFEMFSTEEQRAFATGQYDTYTNSLPNAGMTKMYLSRTLDLEVKDNA